jgi:hypothetical protein
MATFAKVTDGYGAAFFVVRGRDGFLLSHVEIQVDPAGFKVRHDRGDLAWGDRASWVGADAVAVAAAVCGGGMPADVLADWCDDNEPVARDHGFDVGRILRMAS